MKRSVEPEFLDTLPPEDPRARRSRRDLRRINSWMRNPVLVARGLGVAAAKVAPHRIVELGAGDGHLMLRVARLLAPSWPAARVTLLDRQPVVAAETLSEFAALGWRAQARTCEVHDWAVSEEAPVDAVVANLFLHHFVESQLARLFEAIAARARCFVAVEPRRGTVPLLGGRLLWLIGCNQVTRHDAVVSIRAGFTGHELSALWPRDSRWELTEKSSGAFSHVFIARRKE